MQVERSPVLGDTVQDPERIVAASDQRIRPRHIGGLAEVGAVEDGQRRLWFPQQFGNDTHHERGGKVVRIEIDRPLHLRQRLVIPARVVEHDPERVLSYGREGVEFGGVLGHSNRFSMASRDRQETRIILVHVIQFLRTPRLGLGTRPIPIVELEPGHRGMGFPEVRIQFDRLHGGRPRISFVLRKPSRLEQPS